MMIYIAPIILAFVISLVLTPLVRKFAINHGIMDVPKDDRRVHKSAMPLMGGVAIYIAVIIGLFIFVPISSRLFGVVVGATLILISGIIDDWKGLSPTMKIVFQLAAGIALILGGIRIDFVTNPFTASGNVYYLSTFALPLTLIWVVGISNTINLIDGLDGLASGVTLIASFFLMLVASKFGHEDVAQIAALLMGACLGFLPFNFYPAKIFMGDTGALFLGYMLAVITIDGVMKSVATVALVLPIIILGVPIFDTFFAIVRRTMRGQSFMAADKGHLHHRLLNRGLNQKQTVLILYGITAAFGLFSYLIAESNSTRGVYMSLIIVVIASISFFFLGKGDSQS